MAKAKFQNLKELTSQELGARARDLRQELFNLRVQKATARLEKTHRLRAIRREIAQCETRIIQLRQRA
ncbi:MAG: 50S ribosomal protein L29 [Verrucomicrobia bacterium]|nr:50S ribosomal protein L29 [Verrucomicrobiota bacterium]